MRVVDSLPAEHSLGNGETHMVEQMGLSRQVPMSMVLLEGVHPDKVPLWKMQGWPEMEIFPRMTPTLPEGAFAPDKSTASGLELTGPQRDSCYRASDSELSPMSKWAEESGARCIYDDDWVVPQYVGL